MLLLNLKITIHGVLTPLVWVISFRPVRVSLDYPKITRKKGTCSVRGRDNENCSIAATYPTDMFQRFIWLCLNRKYANMNNRCLKHVVPIQVAWRAVTCLWSRAVSWAWGEVPVCRAQPWLPLPPRYHSPAPSRLSFFHFTSLGQISRSASRPRHQPP